MCSARRIEPPPLDHYEIVHARSAACFTVGILSRPLRTRQFHPLFLLCRVQEENENNKRLAGAAREEAERWKARFEAERALKRALNAKVLDMQVRRKRALSGAASSTFGLEVLSMRVVVRVYMLEGETIIQVYHLPCSPERPIPNAENHTRKGKCSQLIQIIFRTRRRASLCTADTARCRPWRVGR